MSPLTQADWHRRQINAFTKSEEIRISLKRPEKQETLSGGRRSTRDRTLPEQWFRLVPFKRRLTREWGLSDGGEAVRNVDWILTGAHDADVQEGDYFVKDGLQYQVKVVSDHRLYRTAATLILRGKAKTQ